MALDYAAFRHCLAGRRLPLAVVDLDALDRNLARVTELVRPRGTPIRLASKSLRVPSLLRRLVDRDTLMQGVMCFAVEEAEYLADEHGFDDLLVAYPAFQRCDIERAVGMAKRGLTIRLMADSTTGLDRLSEVACAHAATLDVVLDVDMSLRIGPAHLGVRRSPLHTPHQVVSMANAVADRPGLRFVGLMGYEAQVAGLGDDNPFEPLLNPIKSALRRASVSELTKRRSAMVEALRQAGLKPALVNGGGTGSLDTTTPGSGVTEVTAGSAFFKPQLFDYYRSAHVRALEPACFFALEVTRRPSAAIVTCLGGGYVASGAAHADKVPRPHLPRGIELLDQEMCGEVQTPLRCPGATPAIGDPVIFRHAKAGELAERFNSYLLIDKGEPVGEAATYRGEGRCFF